MRVFVSGCVCTAIFVSATTAEARPHDHLLLDATTERGSRTHVDDVGLAVGPTLRSSGKRDLMNILTATRRTAASSTPFLGNASSIPGTIPTANFDEGGEGVAYHDTTTGNTGGAYRQSDVDLESSVDGGYDVGWIAAGEWLNYTVSVASAGQYTVTFRVASSGLGGTFHLEMRGVDVTGPIAIPNTGGFQLSQTISTPLTLSSPAPAPQPTTETARA